MKKYKEIIYVLPYFAFCLLIPQCFIDFKIGNLSIGISMILMLFVPCSISVINTNKILWLLRQFAVFSVGIAHFYLTFK